MLVFTLKFTPNFTLTIQKNNKTNCEASWGLMFRAQEQSLQFNIPISLSTTCRWNGNIRTPYHISHTHVLLCNWVLKPFLFFLGFCIGNQMQEHQWTVKSWLKFLNVLRVLMASKVEDGKLLLIFTDLCLKVQALHVYAYNFVFF